MSEKVTVLDLLDELEEIVNTASNIPLSDKVMVDSQDVLSIVGKIRKSLPDDVQQARWIREEKDRILDDAKNEYNKVMYEAKKQADQLLEEHVITERAKALAAGIYNKADEYAMEMRLKSYRYVEDNMAKLRETMDELNEKYIVTMFDELSKNFQAMDSEIIRDIQTIRGFEEAALEEPRVNHRIDVNLGSDN